MRKLYASPQFTSDFRALPPVIQLQTNRVVQQLRLNPVDSQFNITKLKSVSPPAWRIRISSYRLIYNFDIHSVTLLRVRHRKDVYRNL